MNVSQVLALGDYILKDDDLVTYPQKTRLSALNNACLAVINVRPDACVEVATVTLRAGGRQALPDNALRLLEPCYLLDGEGHPVMPVELVVRSEVDRLDPHWLQGELSEEVIEVMFDERLPRVFWTNPPAQAGVQLEMVFSVPPVPVSTMEEAFPLTDKYAPAVMEWVLYLLFSSDSERSTNQARAADHRNNFYQLLQVKTQSEMQVSPVRADAGG